jgi:hypothetical protein
MSGSGPLGRALKEEIGGRVPLGSACLRVAEREGLQQGKRRFAEQQTLAASKTDINAGSIT